MENILARLTDREYAVTVTGEEFTPGWNLYEVQLTSGKDTFSVGQFDLMPLVRMIYQAYEVIQKEETKVEANEALPLGV